ncbi:MAG: ATP-dependent DNA helicase RecG [Salinivirgaceae bacterium]|nr:ATP-dependent DNA helicase RecG [Salinivirgaceae bacterium]
MAVQNIFDTDLKYLKGVGPQRAIILADELGLKTFGDLIYYFPYRYIDRTRFYSINTINEDLGLIQLKGRITKTELVGEGRSQRFVAWFADDTGAIPLVWFKGIKWIKERFMINAEYVVFGKPTEFNHQLNIVHPEVEEMSKYQAKPEFALQPLYNTSEKMKNKMVTTKTIHQLQINLHEVIKNATILETLPRQLLEKLNMPNLKTSLQDIHLPKNQHDLQRAQLRLKFEELFYIQLKLLRLKGIRSRANGGHRFEVVGQCFNNFYNNHLPFSLTNAQKRVLREIRQDTNTGLQMNRLLQGDVGSGKTLVALMSMLLALDNGYQACIMAPTEILAQQHYKSFCDMLAPMGIDVGLLTGSTKQSTRTQLLADLASGQLKILVGTHALIEDRVVFSSLGLVVIDEQHRFGVAQRAKLWSKNQIPPHVLVMTATPIPRTLAMTLYGDLDVSVIDELPPGRKPIRTMHYNDSRRLTMFGFLREQLKLGRQVYIVYPLISEPEASDLKYLEDGVESITRAFPEYAISVVHGRMKPSEKEQSMSFFSKGISQIMIATTVIEVGVNVPNASVMVIENAERFGLSQLHQLRGRVGRGADQSYCILMTGDRLTTEGRKRIQTMVETNDGFEIAEADLKLRGPGDIEGTQQSGVAIDLKIADLGKDNQILMLARNEASLILESDPNLKQPEHVILDSEIKRRWKYEFDWGQIS